MRRVIVAAICAALWACGGGPQAEEGSTLDPADDPDDDGTAQRVEMVKYEQKTRELLEANQKLGDLRGQVDEQRRRLSIICIDHPDHEVCQPQTQAMYARKAFCEDPEFTHHVDEVVKACHRGECKQLDQANEISRSQYMLLTQRLPHALTLFRANRTQLDRDDKKQLQRFLEVLQGEKGFVIVVGRASRDGDWRKNIQLAIDRANATRAYLVDEMGMDSERVGIITYGAEKMYLTELDAERLTDRKLTVKQANRSALVFAYPCWEGVERAF